LPALKAAIPFGFNKSPPEATVVIARLALLMREILREPYSLTKIFPLDSTKTPQGKLNPDAIRVRIPVDGLMRNTSPDVEEVASTVPSASTAKPFIKPRLGP
jgi:hypothetical protein